MKIPLALLAIFCAVLLFAASMHREKLKITTRDDKTVFTVVITLFDVTPEYRWLAIHGCSAEVYEHGTFCTGDWASASTIEIRQDQNQYPFPWRVPRGTLQITSVVFDQDEKVLARGQKTVLRGR